MIIVEHRTRDFLRGRIRLAAEYLDMKELKGLMAPGRGAFAAAIDCSFFTRWRAAANLVGDKPAAVPINKTFSMTRRTVCLSHFSPL